MKFFRVFLLVLSTVSLVLAPATGVAQLTLVESTGGRGQLEVFGDVKTVLDGESTGTAFQQISTSDYLAALGCAAVQPDAAQQGETLFLRDHVFVKSVDAGKNYQTERRLGDCWGSFVAGLTSGSVAAARYRIETTAPLTVDALYQDLHARHGGLVGVIGLGTFAKLDLSAVRKAPAYGEPILGPKKEEYFHPVSTRNDVRAVFFGMSLRSNAEATPKTRRAFYINPDDKLGTAGQSHTHCGILQENAPATNISPLDAAGLVDEAAHVLSQSTLVAGEVLVFEVSGE